MSNELIENIVKVHTTAMGIDRIRKNLGLEDIDIAAFCRSRILDKSAIITRRGKNWYVRINGCVIMEKKYSKELLEKYRDRL